MTFDDVINQYQGVLREKYARLDRALEAFRLQFPSVVSAAKLPMPSLVPRAGVGSVSDIVTVSWSQEVARPGRMAVVRLDWTVSISAFHLSVRDPRDPTFPHFNEEACSSFKVPQWFIDRALELVAAPDLPFDRWEAKIYTY